jgi:hypothetical protein
MSPEAKRADKKREKKRLKEKVFPRIISAAKGLRRKVKKKSGEFDGLWPYYV